MNRYQVQLSDETVLEIEAPTPEEAEAAGDAWFADDQKRKATAKAPSRAGHMIINGLTLGLRPRIAALMEAGKMSGPAYEAAKKQEWAKDDAYRRENPWGSFGLEMAGSLPTMFLPGLNAGRIAQAANAGASQLARGGTWAARLGRHGRNIAGMGPTASLGHEAGNLGARTAAAYGFGSSREDTMSGRASDAAMSMPLGYAFGRGANAVFNPMVGAAETVSDAARLHGHGRNSALSGVRRAMTRAGETAQSMREMILPHVGRLRLMPDGGRETILEAYSQAIRNGATEDAARQIATQAYHATGNMAERTARDHVNRTVERYMQNQGNIPLAIDEVAKLSGNRARDFEWTRRSAANAPGEGADDMLQRVADRQEDILPAVRGRVDDTMGDADVLAAKETLVDRNNEMERALYGIARENEQPFDLTPVWRELVATDAFRTADPGDAIRKAATIMGLEPTAMGGPRRMTLDMYIQARQRLNRLIDDSYKESALGQRKATTSTGDLMDLKRKLDAIVEGSNPDWKRANDLTAGGRTIADAIDEGAQIALDATNNRSLNILRKVENMNAEINRLSRMQAREMEDTARLGYLMNQREAYRMGFARTMHKAIDGRGDYHDISKMFLKGGRGANSGVRRTIRIMMGENTDDFMRLMERAKIASSTFRTYAQSQTTPLKAKMDEMNVGSRIAGMMNVLGYVGRPTKILEDAAEMAANRLQQGRDAELARIYNTMTDDPGAMLALLREIEEFGTQRARFFAGERANAYSAPAIGAGAFTGNAIQDNEQENPYYAGSGAF